MTSATVIPFGGPKARRMVDCHGAQTDDNGCISRPDFEITPPGGGETLFACPTHVSELLHQAAGGGDATVQIYTGP